MALAIDGIQSVRKHIHFDISPNGDEDLNEILLGALPAAWKFIRDATDNFGSVLVHSPVESRATIVLCAYSEFQPAHF